MHFRTEDRLRHEQDIAQSSHRTSLNEKVARLDSLRERYQELYFLTAQVTNEFFPITLGCVNQEDRERNYRNAVRQANQTSEQLQRLQAEIDAARVKLNVVELEYQRRFGLLEFDINQQSIDLGPP